MRDLRIPAALFFTSSLFLVHCSSAEDPAANNSGTSGTSGTSGGSAGTSPGGAGKAGAGGGAGVTGTGGSMSGTSGTTGGAGSGGTGGAGAGQGGRGGAGAGGTGAGGGSMAGGAGLGAGGMPAGGMGGQSGSAGSGGGMAGNGGGMAGNAGGGVAGSAGGAMTLTSTVITEGGMFPDDNTCAGTNESPDLTWTAGPSGTLSYAVVLLDSSITYTHWAIWDIPASVTTLSAALDSMAMPAMPAGAKQKSIQGNGYYGPCPNGTDHVYIFTVYALPVASVTGAMTSETPATIATDIMAAEPLGSASLSAHSSASMN